MNTIKYIEELELGSFFRNLVAGWRVMIDFGSRKIYSNMEEDAKQRDKLVPIVYSFENLSKLMDAVSLIGPVLAINIRPGRSLSQKSVRFWYLYCIFVACLAIAMVLWIYPPLFERTRLGLVKKVADFIIGLAYFAAIFYVTYCPLCLAYLYYQRNFLHDFVLYECSSLIHSELFQFENTVSLFAVSYLSCFMDQPLNTILVIYDEFEQTKFLPQMSKAEFQLMKVTFSFVVAILATSLSLVELLVPILTCLLSRSMEKYLSDEFEKQTRRLGGLNESGEDDQLKKAQVGSELSSILADYKLESFCHDWPPINSSNESKSGKSGCENMEAGAQSNPSDINLPKELANEPNSSDHFEMGKRLFLSRNLLKNMEQLRGIGRVYEDVFGRFHIILICINVLLLAEWIIIGLNRIQLANTPNDLYSLLKDPIVWRITLPVLAFVTNNVIMFHHLNQLPDRVRMIKTSLFKINLDIVTKQRSCGCKTDQAGEVCRDLEETWQLYDHICRIGEQVNFKLYGRKYYDRSCLLLIFRNTISFVLFYLQVLDVYNND